MRDDIETLLQGAGAEPTRELDPSEVHAAGRRRATTRRVATGAGALALLAVVAVGVPQLTSGTPDVDVLPEPPASATPAPTPTPTATATDAPTPTPTPTPTTGDGAGEGGQADAVNVTGVGSTLVELSQAVAFGPVTVTTTTPDGAVSSYATTTGPLDVAYGIAVDGDGRVVFVDEDGVLTRADATSTAPVRSAEEGPWRVVGPTPDGDTWVTRGEVPELSVLTDTDVVPDPSGVAASMAEGALTRATSSDGTTLVVEVFAGEGGEDWVVATGGTTEVVLTQGANGFPQDDQTDFRLEPTYVGDELWWVLQRGEAEPVHDLQVQTADGGVLTVPTPVGRDGVRRVLDVTLGTMPDGGPALLLSTSSDVEGNEPAGVLVDVEAARAAATEQPTSVVPEGVFTDLGDGLLHLQP